MDIWQAWNEGVDVTMTPSFRAFHVPPGSVCDNYDVLSFESRWLFEELEV